MVSHESTKPKKGFEFVAKCETFFFQCGIVSINHPNGVQGETISAMVYSIIKNRPTTNGYNCHELLHEIQIINQGDVQ
jgi:hypothetical protein